MWAGAEPLTTLEEQNFNVESLRGGGSGGGVEGVGGQREFLNYSTEIWGI